MFKRFNFTLVNVISKTIPVNNSSTPETHSHITTFHDVRTFTLAEDLLTKMFLEWLESYEKITLLRGKEIYGFKYSK